MSAEQYTVGWICAIKPEFVAAQEFLDEEHDAEGISAAVHDNNSYAFGRIGQHNVVIAVLPDGEYGTSSAATVVRDMVHSFPNIRIGLMVGIGGGAPTSKDDVRLGDIVVSAPRGGNSGVFEYDFGKTIQEQAFQHTRHLDQPPNVVRTAVTNLQAQYERKGHNIQEAVTDITGKNKRLRKYRRPDHSTDVLYQSNYLHTSGTGDCTAGCGTDSDNIVLRAERDEDEGDDDPAVHYGLIASANQLMKDATVRDRLAAEKGVLCFEMEAAGLMNHFPCLVVRGICDYSDTHKNDNWHGYAAMTAAAYAKDLLGKILPSKVEAEKKLADAVESVKQEMHDFQETIFMEDIERSFTEWAQKECFISLQHSLIQDDIQAYIRHELRPGGRFDRWQGTPRLQQIESTLMAKVDGMFRWAACQLIEELADALAVNLSESPKFDPAFRMPRPTEICLYCPSMLLLARTRKRARDQLDGYKEVLEVRLAHFSVKEYLTSDRLHAELRPLIEPSISRASLADICVAYLSEIKDAMTKHQIEEAFPFASYSAQSWLDHAAASRSLGHGAENGGLILDFLSSDNVAYENWFVMFDPEASFKITKPASGLYYACLYGLVSEVKSLLSQHVAVNEQGGRQGYPIVVASDKGHIKIVDLLIANGADVNLKDPFDLTALHVAASGGYVEIVQLLLDANAEVNAMTAEYETSLGWACSNGHLKVVRLLLDWGAVMKPPGGMSVNVLQLACSYGHVEIVRLLLNKGADVNGLGEHSESPLESAAAYGDVRIVSLLLQHGASLTLLPNQIGDALESAAAYGDERIMRILLDAGISVGRSTERDDCASLADEEQDGHAMLALWVAAKNRHVGAVRMLLDAGVGPNNAWAKNNGILQRFYNPHGQQEVEIIKLLLDHGFDVNDPESADESALEGAVRAGRDDIVAVYEGHRNIARLLLERGADTGRVAKRHYPIGHRFDDPLLRAYKMRDWESVQMLLDYGASLDTVAGESCKNHSFLEIVCLDNDMHAVKMLLHRGVDVSLGLPVACYQGYVALVEVMLDGGSDISIHNTRYGDPLGAASYGGHVEVVRLLIERGAPVDASSPIYGSALIAASSRGHEKVINALLDEGANLNSNIGSHEDPKESGMPQNFAKLWSPADENGNIPASYGNALQAACHEGHEDTAWLLINRGADVNGPGGCYGSALAATSYCGKASIVQLLLESGASANSPGGIHGNALLSACRRGREDIVRILINNGANEDLDESLSTAIRGGHTHAVQTILEICQNRVSLDSNNLKDAIKTYDDCLIGMILDTMGTLTEETGIGPLQAAAATGKRDLVQTLQDRGASLTAEKLDFNEALVNASAKGDIDVVNFLLELGANPNQQYVITSEGQRWMYSSALHAASQAGHLEITQLLLQSGADATSPGGKYQYLTRAVIVSYDMDRFEMRNKYGQDLEQDVVERFEAIVKMLFVHGVDARWVRQDYNECLHQSTCVGFGTIVKILIEKGADINFYFEKSNTDVLEAALWCGYLHIAWILVDQGCHIPDSHWERYYGAQRKTLLHFAADLMLTSETIVAKPHSTLRL
ncbi:Ankyrin-1 [Colletotrichum fructicola]|nr:Ankyrin-1 [Colletotrichum fructicola]